MKIRKTLWKTNIQPTQKYQENVPRITGWKRHSDAFTCLLIINECDGKVQQAFSLALGQSQNANQNFVVFTHWKERLLHKAFHFLCWAFNFNPRRTSKNIEAHGADAASQAEVPCHCGLHTRSSASDAARNLAEILGCRSVQIGADRFNGLMFLPICAGSPIFWSQ